MNFKNSGKIKQIWMLTTPLVVPIADDPDSETSNQLISRQEKFLKLSQGIKKKLSRVETSQKIQVIGQKYGFELLRLANITRLIREYYFGEVRFENFPAEIEKRMGVSLLTAQEITRYLKQEIIDWDPWAEYLAKLPKMPIREIVAKHPKIADTEITDEYIELKGSDDLADPSIKNWLKDYISHLGYNPHSQMDRTQYIFHSENGKNLSSQDREKLGIILKSFDENIPLSVDEENQEIVFDIVEQKPKPVPQPSFAKATASKQESFIKPYAPIPARIATRSVAGGSQPALPPRPQPQPAPPQETIHPDFTTQPNKQVNSPPHISPRMESEADREINKYFSAPETPDIPSIKIHSITEHNEPKMAQQVPPKQNIQRSVFPGPISAPQQPEQASRPKYKIIDPFFSKPRPEPRLDGNIVDLSEQ
ncbi:MAG: hypothetical protein WC726_00975 [Parcubacteria group bacterium]|jgi:hypothetical protein